MIAFENDELCADITDYGRLMTMLLLLCFQIDAHTDTLISEQASVILGSCGLAQIYGIAQQHQPQQVCSCASILGLV